jgi:hypothetical protein
MIAIFVRGNQFSRHEQAEARPDQTAMSRKLLNASCEVTVPFAWDVNIHVLLRLP